MQATTADEIDTGKAPEQARAELLDTVYEQSGVNAHLSWVNDTVRNEAIAAQHSCLQDDDLIAVKATIEQSITNLLSLDALHSGFIDAVSYTHLTLPTKA